MCIRDSLQTIYEPCGIRMSYRIYPDILVSFQQEVNFWGKYQSYLQNSRIRCVIPRRNNTIELIEYFSLWR